MNLTFFWKTIGRKLGASFGTMLLVTLIIGGIALFGLSLTANTIQDDLTIAFELLLGAIIAQTSFDEALDLEKQYLLRFSLEGLQTARTQYVDPWIIFVASTKETLNEIDTLESNDDSQILSNSDRLRTALDRYEESFLELVTLIEQRGVEEEGIIGAFRQDIHELETVVEELRDFQAEVLMLEARRREKDYMLRGDALYVQNVRDLVASLQTHVSSMEIDQNLKDRLRSLADSYRSGFEALVAIDEEIARQTNTLWELGEAIKPLFGELDDSANTNFTLAKAMILEIANTVVYGVVIALSVAVIFGIGFTIVVTRSMTVPLADLVSVTRRVGKGDLSQPAVVTTIDEIGTLGHAFNSMVEDLRRSRDGLIAKEYLEGVVTQYQAFVARVSEGDLTARLDLDTNNDSRHAQDDLYLLGINLMTMAENLNVITGQVRESVQGITSAAAEIQAATSQQISSATEQDAAVAQTVATVEELRATVQQTSERSREVAVAAQQSLDVSERGEQAVEATVHAMVTIRQQVENIAGTILHLSERTQQIGEIISSVNEIADQSKLLALNASIEAARAGEEGRGFAVVAGEVRQLAEQSRQATARVGEILSEIQHATNTAVMVTEEGSKSAESGMALANRAGDAIRELAEAFQQTAQLSVQIAASAHQQLNGMDQLSSAMREIKQASTQSAVSSQQTEQSARNLNATSRQLEQAISRYKLEIN